MLLVKERNLPALLFFGIILILIVASCSTGPSTPRVGTPEFYWRAAQDTFAAGDYEKANNNLEELLKSENQFTARAQPWRLVVAAGMAKGYMELADSFEAGGRANKINPTPFRTQMNDYRTMGQRAALQFAETFLLFKKHDHGQDVPLAFSFPTGSAAPVKELEKIGFGVLLPEPQLQSVHKRTMDRALLLVACEAAGAPEDVAKAQAKFQAGEVKVPHDTFVLPMANHLHAQTKLFDRPERRELFCNEALEALKTVKESKESKELTAKIEKTLKSIKVR